VAGHLANAILLPRCLEPIEPGPCKGFEIRYGYDKAAEKCTRFAYGGCGGNSNNFDSRERCEKMCVESKNILQNPSVAYDPLVSNARCLLPIRSGSCTRYQGRYGFDVRKEECTFFMYGGCGGNANRFLSREECEQACLAKFTLIRT
ncbi:unnamed protein product, partial [Cylicocyclus nassatus]